MVLFLKKNDPESELQCNFPSSFRKDISFDKSLYLTHSKNPTLNSIIKHGMVDNLELQKNLLATGLLQDSIQQSLDMIVTDGGFNDVGGQKRTRFEISIYNEKTKLNRCYF